MLILLDGNIPLSLPHLGFHVPLGQNISEGRTNDRTLEFLRSPGLLFGRFFLLPFTVLASKQQQQTTRNSQNTDD